MTCWYCWWKNSGDHQLRLVSYPIIYRVLYIPGGLLGFLPSTVFPKFCDFTPKKGQQTTNQRSINQLPPNISSFPRNTEKHLTNQQGKGTIPRTKAIPPHRSWRLWAVIRSLKIKCPLLNPRDCYPGTFYRVSQKEISVSQNLHKPRVCRLLYRNKPKWYIQLGRNKRSGNFVTFPHQVINPGCLPCVQRALTNIWSVFRRLRAPSPENMAILRSPAKS